MCINYVVNTRQCAKFICSKEKTGPCAHSDVKDETATVIVRNSCQKDQLCPAFENDSYYEVTKETKCWNKNENSDFNPFEISMPGEPCTKDLDCYEYYKPVPNYIPKCVNLKCLGSKKGEEVTESFQCEAGLFAMKKTDKLVCEEQLNKDEACTSINDCKNNLVC